jgi:diguanylate cyclase (GGDEF)-like protein
VADETNGAKAADLAAPQRARARQHLSAAWLIVLLALIGLGVALTCAAVGYSLARQSDELRAEGQRAALRAGVVEFRALFGDGDKVDPRFVEMVAHSAGLAGLQFETEAPSDSREFQPVLNSQGRITGFLTWQHDAPMTAIMRKLTPLVGVLAFALVGFAGFSLRQLRRARVELTASEAQARDAAERDLSTGLYNQNAMMKRLERAMAARGESATVTYALLALDDMAAIVDSYGQGAADEIIATVASNLKEALPVGADCGRVAAQEFAMLWSGGGEPAGILRDAIEAAAKPHWIDSVVHIGAYAGFAQAPRDAEHYDQLARRAELALRAAAKKGAGMVVAFNPAIDTLASEQQFIRRELPRALKAQALELHYQPIVSADSGRIAGLEALLRWTHKSRGAVPPASFIPVAEQMGLIEELGAFVLRRALHDAKRWPDLYMSVNLLPLQARDRDIARVVRDALWDAGIAPSRLMLEITEGVLIDNPEEMLKRIEDLRRLGVRIALDDFGSGYSSLGYLQRFPFDKLKVDRSFASTLGRSPNGGVIIQAIVSLGRALGVSVVVEGVETEEQRVLLRLAGCDEMQGFLFARPAPAQSIDRLLDQRRQARTAAA